MADPRLTLDDVLPHHAKPWWRTPHLLKLNTLLFIPFLTSYIVGFDSSMLNGIQTVPHWHNYFGNPTGALLGLVVTAQLIGGVCSLPLGAYCADRFGRRLPVVLSSVLALLGVGLQSGAINLPMFVIGKFIVGFGGAIGATATAPLLAELAYPTHRPIFTAVYNTTWYVGSIVAAWVTYGTFKMPNSWSWRIPSILQGVVSVIQLTCIYLVPESPRWLIANNQAETATRILCKYHAGTEEPNDLVRFEVAEITAALQFERAQRSTSYLQFFRTRGNRHRLLIATLLGFMIQWCGNGLISYYLALILTSIGIDDPKTQNIINGVLQIFNLMVAVMAACLVDRLGRRFLFLLSTAGMMVSFIIWTAISARNEQQNFESKSLGIGVVTMVFIFFAFYNLAMMPLPITYLVEILPYTLRAKGIAVFNFSQLSSAIFNGFVNPIAMERISWKYYIVYVCAIGLWLVVIFFGFPETRGLSLESVSRVFDDEDWQHQADEKTKPGQEASPKVQDVWIDEVSKQ